MDDSYANSLYILQILYTNILLTKAYDYEIIKIFYRYSSN